MPSIAEMERKGWGDPGEPNSPEAAKYVNQHIKSVSVADRTFRVRREVAPLFHALVLLMERNGVDISKGVLDDWGYANRDIRGIAGSKSMHSWGLAIDLDATKNVLGSSSTSFPVAATKKAAEACSLDWGYLWDGRKDPMHFEFTGSRAQVAAALAKLKARHPLIYRKVTR